MVKKKAPFIPITIVVIGVGFVFAMNARSHPVDPETEAKRQQALASQQEHPKDDPDSMTRQVQAAVKKPKDGAPLAAKGPAGPDDLDPMRVVRQVKYKPSYNPTTAEAHWYQSK